MMLTESEICEYFGIVIQYPFIMVKVNDEICRLREEFVGRFLDKLLAMLTFAPCALVYSFMQSIQARVRPQSSREWYRRTKRRIPVRLPAWLCLHRCNIVQQSFENTTVVRTLSRHLLQLTHSRCLAIDIFEDEGLFRAELERFDDTDGQCRGRARNGFICECVRDGLFFCHRWVVKDWEICELV